MRFSELTVAWFDGSYLEAWCEERVIGVPCQVQVPEHAPAKLLKVGQVRHLAFTVQFSLYSIVFGTKKLSSASPTNTK